MSPLVTGSIELSLDLLEKNGMLVPFCKARTDSPEALYLSPDSVVGYTRADAMASLRRELESRRSQIYEFVLCSEVYGRRDEETEDTHFLKVEYQSAIKGDMIEGIYYFPILSDAGRLSVKTYDRFDLKEKIM